MKQWSEYIHSKTARKILMGIGALIIILLIFDVGILVGYKKGTFSCRLSDNYFRIFGEEQGDNVGLNTQIPQGEMPTGHGAVGTIAHIDLPVLIVANADKLEKSVHISDSTIIRRINKTIHASDLKIDDFVVVVGSSNNQGQVEAKLIRVLPPSPTVSPTPIATGTASSI